LKLEDFLKFDRFQVIFPKVQDDKTKKFVQWIQMLCNPDVTIYRKPSYDYKKRSLKSKDVHYLEFKNSKKGILGLILCINEFEEIIEVRGVKDLLKFDIPKDIRDISEEYYDYFKEEKKNYLKGTSDENTIIKSINSSALIQIKSLLNNKKR